MSAIDHSGIGGRLLEALPQEASVASAALRMDLTPSAPSPRLDRRCAIASVAGDSCGAARFDGTLMPAAAELAPARRG